MRLLWIALYCLMFGFGIYSATFFNFATDILKIRPEQLGVVEAIRETPGFLCVLVAAITMQVVEPLLATIALFLMVDRDGRVCVGGQHPHADDLVVRVERGAAHVDAAAVLDGADARRRGPEGQAARADGVRGKPRGGFGMLAVMAVGHALKYPTWFLLGSGAMLVAAADDADAAPRHRAPGQAALRVEVALQALLCPHVP